MKMTRGNFNLAHQIFEKATEDIENHLEDNFSVVRDYGDGFGDTRRRKAPPVSGGVRNIYDTGDLAKSVKRTDSYGRVLLRVTAEHAGIVLSGYRTEDVFMPGRDYLSPTIEEFKRRVGNNDLF